MQTRREWNAARVFFLLGHARRRAASRAHLVAGRRARAFVAFARARSEESPRVICEVRRARNSGRRPRAG